MGLAAIQEISHVPAKTLTLGVNIRLHLVYVILRQVYCTNLDSEPWPAGALRHWERNEALLGDMRFLLFLTNDGGRARWHTRVSAPTSDIPHGFFSGLSRRRKLSISDQKVLELPCRHNVSKKFTMFPPFTSAMHIHKVTLEGQSNMERA